MALLRRRGTVELDRDVEDSCQRLEPLSRAPVERVQPRRAPRQRQSHPSPSIGLPETAEH